MVSIAEILKGRHTGKEVELRGWIYRTRSVGGKAFVVVRDATGIVQVAISRDAVPTEAFAAAQKALIESAVIVHGKVVEDKRAPGGFEIRAEDFTVVHFAEKFPIREALVLGMEKIYYIGPSFRAEKSRTTRHLTEYWHAEMEQAWAGMDDVIKHAEGVISHACQRVAEERADDVIAMGRTPEFLKAVKPPFERMTYDEALKVLKEKGVEIEWGKDLRTLEERALTEGKSKPIIVTHYPRVTQAFYKARDPKHPDLVLAFDVIGGDGVGEIVGGSERETDLETIRKGLKEQGEDPKAYDWYLDSRRYGSVQHAGFGMGMERLIQWICKLEHIRDAVRFFAEELMPHLRLEDEAVLPTLENAIGRYGTLVTVVMYEHEEIRRGVAKFDEAREDLRRDPNSWPVIQELNRHGIFLVQFLWDHFRKENTSLFPTARKVLSADAIRKITEQISAP